MRPPSALVTAYPRTPILSSVSIQIDDVCFRKPQCYNLSYLELPQEGRRGYSPHHVIPNNQHITSIPGEEALRPKLVYALCTFDILHTDLSQAQHDLVIIGGGVAGYVAAIKAGQEGMKVKQARMWQKDAS